MIQAYIDLCKHYWEFTKNYGWKITLVIIPVLIIIFIIATKDK